MATKPVSLTYTGDASEALKWVGFAKKKANQLAEWCMSTGQPTGNNWIYPTPDVRIRVWYTNGLLSAQITAEAGGYGFAFKRHDYVNTVDGFWWDIQRTRDNVFIDISKSLKAKGAGAYKIGAGGDIRYGSWPCQERDNGELFTIAEFKLDPGRGFPTFPVPSYAISARRQVRMDVGYPYGNEAMFFTKGIAYATAGSDCYGVFKYAGTLFTIELDGGYTTGAPQGTTIITTIFSSGSDMVLIKVDGGASAASSLANRVQIASQDVSFYTMRSDNSQAGLFLTAPDGSASLAKYHDTPTSVDSPLVYLRMSQVGETIVGTFSTVEVFEDNPTTFIAGDGSFIVPTTVYGKYYDFVQYGGEWVPTRVRKVITSIVAGFGGYIYAADVVVDVDTDFSGAFATPAVTITGVGTQFAGSVSEVLTPPVELNLARGLVLAYGVFAKIDFTDWTYTVLTGDTPVFSFAHTRKDYVLSGQSGIYAPVYTDGELTGYAHTAITDIPGMAAALGDGYTASDATGTYGLLGAI